jgi:HEAT repeat protein
MILMSSSGYGRVMDGGAQNDEEALKDLDDLALVGRVLAIAPNLHDDSDEDDEYWMLVHELHRRGTQLIFEEAARLILSEDPRARGMACDVLSQLGYEHGEPFGAESLPLLARVCTEDVSLSVLGCAVSAMGHLRQPEALPYVVTHAQHADSKVRLSVACALPSIIDCEWLGEAHPVVTTLMQLTSDDDEHVRDWATFGLGTQVNVDGALVRQCLFTRLDDPHDDTRAEALAGLARRHVPEIERHVLDALSDETVHRLAVESACYLGNPSFAELLDELTDWWDVDVDLPADAQRRCNPTRIDSEVVLIQALLDAADLNHLSISVSSELLSSDTGDPKVSLRDAGLDEWYDMAALIRHAGDSVDAAIRQIQHDLKKARSIPHPPHSTALTEDSDEKFGALSAEACLGDCSDS